METYIKGYRLQIYPTEEQKKLIDRYIELYRFVYNWGKYIKEIFYKKKINGNNDSKIINFHNICKMYSQLRNSSEYNWLQEMPLTTGRLALRDMLNSFKMFFIKQNDYPKFKTKKHSPKMFKTRSDRFYIEGDCIRFEGLERGSKRNKTGETISLGFDTGFRLSDRIKYIEPSISMDYFGNYWVSFSIDTSVEHLDCEQSEPIGVDVGIRHTMTLSTGEIFNRPNAKIKKLEKRLSRTQRHVTRDIKRRMKQSIHTKTKYDDIPVSRRSKKRLDRRNKIYAKITHIKEAFYHKTIKSIVKRNPKAIVIETLRTKEMQRASKSHYLDHELAHADFYKMHRIFIDKCNRYGVKLIQADIEYPSSQLCSHCGYRQDIGSNHTYRCPICGLELNRDINAAINLRKLA